MELVLHNSFYLAVVKPKADIWNLDQLEDRQFINIV